MKDKNDNGKKDFLNQNSEITPKELFENRREFLKLGAGSLIGTALADSALGGVLDSIKSKLGLKSEGEKMLSELKALQNARASFKISEAEIKAAFLKEPNLRSFESANFLNKISRDFDGDQARFNGTLLGISREERFISYCNFYEFGVNKTDPAKYAHTLQTSPWSVEIAGLVEKEQKISLDELIAKMPLCERVYRFRCVEAWSMVVPWLGFTLRDFFEFARPKKEAKYLRFTSVVQPNNMPGARGPWRILDFPYVEVLRRDEAESELALLTIGAYREPLKPQNGAPLRLVVPWKYGYKYGKSICKIEFLSEEPKSTWQRENPKEYGFYGNVDPFVPHPRWSQASERVIGIAGSGARTPTLYLNGYEEVAHLYKGMDRKSLY